MFNWKELETEEEVALEVAFGLAEISYDMVLNIICSCMLEYGITVKQVKDKLINMTDAEITGHLKTLRTLFDEHDKDKRESMDSES